MASMTDQPFVNKLMQCIWSSSTTVTITPGTSGGSAFSITPPMKLKLDSAQGSNTAAATELTTSGGYTVGGLTLGSSAFGTPAAGVQTNNNAVSWSATGAWSTVVSIEVWDSAAVRYLQGALTSSITGVANGDTVQFASASISISGATW